MNIPAKLSVVACGCRDPRRGCRLRMIQAYEDILASGRCEGDNMHLSISTGVSPREISQGLGCYCSKHLLAMFEEFRMVLEPKEEPR